MKVAIIKERRPHERRVAATPDSVKRISRWVWRSTVESGAGAEAYFADDAYTPPGRRSSATARPRWPMPISF